MLVVMYSSEESGAESVATRSSTVSPSSSLGQPRKSLVWNYFIYDDVSGKSICQVSTGESNEAGSSSSGPNVCGKTCAGKFPFNLKQHLKTCHVACYQELLNDERKQIKWQSLKPLRSTGPTRSKKKL